MNHRTTLLTILAFAPFLASAATNVWTGGGDGSSWDDPANWGGTVPVAGDTAVFSASATVNTSDASTISLCDISVADGATVIVSAKVDIPSDVTWDVGEGAMLRFNAAMSGAGGVVKEGAGELWFNVAGSRTGSTEVNEGVLSLTNQKELGTSLVVGDGVHDATVQMRYTSKYSVQVFSGNATILVRNHGVLDFETLAQGAAALNVNNSVTAITVEEGGIFKAGRFLFIMPGNSAAPVFSCAGTTTSAETMGGIQFRSGQVTVPETITQKVTIDSRLMPQRGYNNGTLYGTIAVPSVQDVPVELELAGPVVSSWSGLDGINKRGAGTLRLSSSRNNYGGDPNEGLTRIYEGTVLVDNVSGSGTGYSKVDVRAGTTLGGTGFIGGLTEDIVISGRSTAYATNAIVTATGTSGNPAVIAPGTIGNDTGAHICGTLTVGGAEQSSSVTFGNYTTLRVSLDAPDLHDCLRVYGTIDIGATGTALEISLPTDIAAMRPGNYVIASATEGISGSFASRSLSSDGIVVTVGANEIVATIPRRETVLFLR